MTTSTSVYRLCDLLAKGRTAIAICLAGTTFWAAEPCAATTVVDPSGDVLNTYVGQVGPDLDILQFTVTLDANNVYLYALLNGAPGTTALSRYNIGIDRGAGTDTFPAGFRLGVSQDAVVNLMPATLAAEVRLFVGGNVVSATPLPSGAFTISGNSVSVVVPLSMLPSTGFAPQGYSFLLWSRTQIPGVPVQLGVADFAPDQGLLALVPEPSTWAMLLIGFGCIGGIMRRDLKRLCSHPI